MNKKSYLDELKEEIQKIDTSYLSDFDESERKTSSEIVEEPQVYIWVRIYLKEEIKDIEQDDLITIEWKPTGETIKSYFKSYDKKNINKNEDDNITSYEYTDDKKALITMVDEKVLKSNDVKVLRTFFKGSPYYQERPFRKSDLILTNNRTGENIEYTFIDF